MRKFVSTILTASIFAVLLASVLGPVLSTSVFAQENTSANTSNLIAQGANPATPTTPTTQANPATNPANAQNTPEETAGEGDVYCENSVGVLGWIICPVIRLTYEGFRFMVDNVIADGLLKIDLTESQDALVAAWSGFRTIANLVFVLVFLVIIYAEATGGYGFLETYSLTRILPRLAFSVIGIQLSYFIASYLVGLFNDLGEGVTQLVLAPVNGFSEFDLTFSGGDNTWFGLDLGSVGGGFVDSFIGIAAVAVVGWIAYIVLESVLVFALFGLAFLFATLIIRKVIIIALVVISPVAFALFVLPGTERFFKLWWESFIKALAMYPFIMLFIASGQLVGRLAIAGDNVSFIDSVVSMVATFAPLFLIPATFKLAGSAVATIAGGLGGMADKVKGDIRDPNSTRSRLRQRRGQRYGRLLGGQAQTPRGVGFNMPKSMGGRRVGMSFGPLGGRALMPNVVRRTWDRLPSTDSSASLMADIFSGREAVSAVAKSLGDDVVKAAAVTGGGAMRGYAVNALDTSGNARKVWSGHAKLGSHFAYDEATGSIITRDGIAQMYDEFGNMSNAKTGNFYDKNTMSQVSKYAVNRGFMAASSEHAMSKTDNNNYADQQQIWYGLDGSKWNASEKKGMAQGVWNNVKDQGIHHKFNDWDNFFHDGALDRHDASRDKVIRNPETGQVKRDVMGVQFGKLLNFIDGEMQAYPLQNQKAPVWNALSQGVVEFATDRTKYPNRRTAMEIDATSGRQHLARLHSLAYKAVGLINQDRAMNQGMGQQVINVDDDHVVAGNTIASGSSATGSAAREAKRFLQLYKQHIGPLPGGEVRGLDDQPSYYVDNN